MPTDRLEQQSSTTGPHNSVESHFGPWPVRARPQFGGASHPGLVRRANEDHFLVTRRYRKREVLLTNMPPDALPPTEEEAFALAVADGVGGAVFGELASRLAITTAWDLGTRENRWLMNVGEVDRDSLEAKLEAWSRLLTEAFQAKVQEQPSLRGMGTTLTAAYTVGRHVFIAHIGDSRAYLLRGAKIQRLTRDHTLAAAMVAAGVPPHEVAHVGHVLTNCLIGKEGRSVSVDSSHWELQDGDCLLLCTDGLSDLVRDDEMAVRLAAEPDPQRSVDSLIALALERGGKDNITVVVGRYEFVTEPSPPG